MSDPILHYLIVFDRRTLGREILEFGEDIQAALAAYAQKEDEYEDDSSIEVVLVGSDSIESVKGTHGISRRSLSPTVGSRIMGWCARPLLIPPSLVKPLPQEDKATSAVIHRT